MSPLTLTTLLCSTFTNTTLNQECELTVVQCVERHIETEVYPLTESRVNHIVLDCFDEIVK